jgi:hypothetical protein
MSSRPEFDSGTGFRAARSKALADSANLLVFSCLLDMYERV